MPSPVERNDRTGCAIHASARAGAHVRRSGSDIVRGQPLLVGGTRLGPAALAALAATGHVHAAVHRRPRVAILATGDELAAVGEPLGPASIPDSNSESIAAQVQAAGAEPMRLGIAIDDMEAVRERLLEGIVSADVLVASGGVSVGARDVVKEVFEEVGSLDLWRVAVQPGKPLAYRQRTATGRRPLRALRAARQPRQQLRDLRAVRAPGPAPTPGGLATGWAPRREGRASANLCAATPLVAPSSGSGSRTRPTSRAAIVLSWRAARAPTSSPPSPRPMGWPSSRRASRSFPPALKWRSSGLTSKSREAWPGQPRRPAAPSRQERRRLSHVDRLGRPRMVDISEKPVTARRAVAEATVKMDQETLTLVIDGSGPKGDVMSVAELAGIMAAKRTAELIPLCHPIAAHAT